MLLTTVGAIALLFGLMVYLTIAYVVAVNRARHEKAQKSHNIHGIIKPTHDAHLAEKPDGEG
jgi:hypothetical protein